MEKIDLSGIFFTSLRKGYVSLCLRTSLVIYFGALLHVHTSRALPNRVHVFRSFTPSLPSSSM